jgi:hypothetical protein
LFVKNETLRLKIQNEFLKKVPDLDKLQQRFYNVNSGKRHGAGLVDCVKIYSLVLNLEKNTELMSTIIMSDSVKDDLLTPF